MFAATAIQRTEGVVDGFLKALKTETKVSYRVINVTGFIVMLVLTGACAQISGQLVRSLLEGSPLSVDITWHTALVIGSAMILGTWLLAKLARRLGR